MFTAVVSRLKRMVQTRLELPLVPTASMALCTPDSPAGKAIAELIATDVHLLAMLLRWNVIVKVSTIQDLCIKFINGRVLEYLKTATVPHVAVGFHEQVRKRMGVTVGNEFVKGTFFS